MSTSNSSLDTIRVDQVGSLVVPADLVEASIRNAKGQLPDAELRQIEDKSIREAIQKQKDIGLPIVTDGEFRRRNFQESFGNAVSGFDSPVVTGSMQQYQDPATWLDPNNPRSRSEPNYNAAGPAIMTRRAAVERLKLKHNVILDEYKFAASVSDVPAKVSLIGPDRISQRFAWERSEGVYSVNSRAIVTP
jgi:5-methyltetrahydropteroyltriglutamate--homocysteine methyltransferase